MVQLKRLLLSYANEIGRRLPKKIQRFIVDFPGILKFLERFSRGESSEIVSPEGYRILINPLFHSNLASLGNLNEYETDIRRAISALTKPGMVAYDVGANVGVFSFLFASIVGQTGTVYAFEPERNNYFYLGRSIELNGTSNVILDNRAIGRDTSVALFDRRGGAFSGRLVNGGAGYQPTHNVVSVPTVCIDDLIEKEGYRAPHILKIDVEGNEGMVLEGMRRTLKEHHPIIVCELHAHLGDSPTYVGQLLIEHGYSFLGLASAARGDAQHTHTPILDISKEHHIVAIKRR